MPTKKRKYEARFPPARIKKIMQTDEDVGKVAAAVPIIISRALEIFLQTLIEKGSKYTLQKKAKTMTTSHLKCCIETEDEFDFLKDLVANVAAISTQEEEDNTDANEPKQRKPRKPREPKEKAPRKTKAKTERQNTCTTDESDNEDTKPSMPNSDSETTSSTSTKPFPSVVFPRESVITPNPSTASTSQAAPQGGFFASLYKSTDQDEDYDDFDS